MPESQFLELNADQILANPQAALGELRVEDEEPTEQTIKVALLGDHSGKSTLLRTFSSGKFPEIVLPTTMGVDTGKGKFYIADQVVEAEVYDLDSSADSAATRQVYAAKSDAIMIAFDCTSEDSFAAVSAHLATVKLAYNNRSMPPVVLVATKVEPMTEKDAKPRVISSRMALEFVEENSIISMYIETGAKKNTGVEQAFLVATALGKMKKEGPNAYEEKIKKFKALENLKEQALERLTMILLMTESSGSEELLLSTLTDLAKGLPEGVDFSAVLNQLRTANGLTLLGLAAQLGKLSYLEILYENAEMDLDEQDQRRRSALYHTVKENHPDCTRYLFEKGARVDSEEFEEFETAFENFCQQDKRTMLGFAIEKGQLGLAVYLVEVVGVDLNKKDQEGRSALFRAAVANQKDCVDYLIRKGAQVGDLPTLVKHLQQTQKIAQRKNPLAAEVVDYTKIVRYLIGISHYLMVGRILHDDPDGLQKLITDGHSVNCHSKDGASILSYALNSRKPESVAVLLENGVQPSLSDQNNSQIYINARNQLNQLEPQQRESLIVLHIKLLQEKLRDGTERLQPFLDELFQANEKYAPALSTDIKMEILERVGFAIRDNKKACYSKELPAAVTDWTWLLALQQHPLGEIQSQHLQEVKDYYLKLIMQEGDHMERERLAAIAKKSAMLGIHRSAFKIKTGWGRMETHHQKLATEYLQETSQLNSIAKAA